MGCDNAQRIPSDTRYITVLDMRSDMGYGDRDRDNRIEMIIAISR